MRWHALVLVLGACALAACSRNKPVQWKSVDSPKLAISIRIPENWRETRSLGSDDNQFAVGDDLDGGAAMVFARSPGGSISKRYPNLPGQAVSLSMLREEAKADRLLRVNEISIGGAKYYCGVEDLAAKPGMCVMRVFFWSDIDAYDVWAVAPQQHFARREPVFRAVIESVAYRPQAQPPPAAKLTPLPSRHSQYTKSMRADTQREEVPTPGLPAGLKRIRHSWGMGWLETVVGGDELYQVRRKVVLFPASMPMAAINAQVVIEVDLKNATGATGFSTGFALWLRDGLASHLQGYPVDTRREEGPLAVHLLREGQDLVVEYARVETQAALAAVAAQK